MTRLDKLRRSGLLDHESWWYGNYFIMLCDVVDWSNLPCLAFDNSKPRHKSKWKEYVDYHGRVIEKIEARAKVINLIHTLSEKCIKAVYAIRVEEMSAIQVGKKLGVAINKATRYIADCFYKLAQKLRLMGVEYGRD